MDAPVTLNVTPAPPAEPPPATLATRLRAVRQARGLTQTELAAKCGTSQAVIQKIENGKSLRPRITDAIADALGVRPEWLERGVIGAHCPLAVALGDWTVGVQSGPPPEGGEVRP